MELYKPTPEELQETLRLHKMWLNNEVGGKRANMNYWNLRSADLRSANLSSADLRSANLSSANLSSADLRSADLYWANLRSADLRSANLSSADLSLANLYSANLYSANLSSADLRSANLSSAKNLSLPIACPSHGAFTAWKKACYCPDKIAKPERTKHVIVELLIPADAKRSSATTRKCRCDKAQVVSITDFDGNSYAEAFSQKDCCFVYKVGETVSVPDYDENRWNECSTGIHFFVDKQEAIEW